MPMYCHESASGFFSGRFQMDNTFNIMHIWFDFKIHV